MWMRLTICVDEADSMCGVRLTLYVDDSICG